VSVPYADGNFEHADGSPIDITSSLCSNAVGGGSRRYAKGYAAIFGQKKRAINGTTALPNKQTRGPEDEYTLFEPSEEWKEVQDGDICPGGLEYRLNMDTGEKLARLPPSDTYNDSSALVITPVAENKEA
jgi:hypothetical protein